ncbi:hypothetical protein [Colwellia asteriadis]
MLKKSLLIASVALITLAGCGSTPPIQAQEKTIAYQGKVYVFGGQYDEKRKEVELTVNGDPVMKGRFPPYTPTLNLTTNYQDVEVSSHCYFSSVLNRQGGVFGAVAGAIQSSNSQSGDKCDIKVAGETLETLYF